MRLLQYKALNLRKVHTAFEKVRAAIEADDFKSADVKKLHCGPYYRAKLDYANRLLLQFARVVHQGQSQTVCLALEVIENHAYERSRFLRGAQLDEAKIEQEPAAQADTAAVQADAQTLRWLHPEHSRFELLDKPLMFDDAQSAVMALKPPLVVVGSAGSGKTAVTLSKLREAQGEVLYVTQSAYLAHSARSHYSAHGYQPQGQEVQFLSFRELLESLQVPPGSEATLPAFEAWLARHRASQRELASYDAHALFEEFRGVLGAQVDGPLSLEAYQALGARQSLLPPELRPAAHALYQRYRAWLDETGRIDSNLVAWQWRLQHAQPSYDFVVVDEVQDLTPVQLALVLALLKTPGHFLLCGDSHQIVHPNFFSWAQVRAMFWAGVAGEAAQHQDVQVLQANYRNSPEVTAIANRLLQVKQARFGSVDRESNFLVRSVGDTSGKVTLLSAKEPTLRQLDQATRRSAQHAVLVLRDEDKPAARAVFGTPLVFSVHEAKGLEYPHVLLFNLVSGQRAAYAEACAGVRPQDLQGDELRYSRAKDKADKSLELYKFYVNALYVALTRAVQTLTLIEQDSQHPLLQLLGLQEGAVGVQAAQVSSQDEWAQEARKLELQGKTEQAQAIRDSLLQHKPVPWQPWSQALIQELAPKALLPGQPSSKLRQTLLDYALWHQQPRWPEQLADQGFAPAKALMFDRRHWSDASLNMPAMLDTTSPLLERARHSLRQKHQGAYAQKNFKDLLRLASLHGPDHLSPCGATPLMLAARAGNVALVQALLAQGANPEQRDEWGHNAWLHALEQALLHPDTAAGLLAHIGPLLAPPTLDVQTQHRLVRLLPHQGEYWVLSLMLAGYKTLWRGRVMSGQSMQLKAFDAECLHTTLQALPPHLWPALRQKRSYVGQVLSRAERDSSYQPSRQLFARSAHGHYLPNPRMSLRVGEAWVPVYELLNAEWVHQGHGSRFGAVPHADWRRGGTGDCFQEDLDTLPF